MRITFKILGNALFFKTRRSHDLFKIINRSAQILEVSIDKKGAEELAKRSRGTPRIANRILRRVRDFSLVNKSIKITEVDVKSALSLMQIDDLGLDRMDRKILSTIKNFFDGGPVGIESLCATLNEERGTLEDVYEPFLLKTGLLRRTARGREISDLAIEHLK